MWSIPQHTWSGQGVLAGHVVHSSAHMVQSGEIPDRPGDLGRGESSVGSGGRGDPEDVENVEDVENMREESEMPWI